MVRVAEGIEDRMEGEGKGKEWVMWVGLRSRSV